MYFLQFWRLWSPGEFWSEKSKIEALAWWIYSEASSLDLKAVATWPLLCECRKEKESKLSSVFSYKSPNPITRAPPSWLHLSPNYFPKASSSNPITLGLGLQHMNLWGHRHLVHKNRECLTLKQTIKYFSKVTVSFYTSRSNVGEFHLSHKFTNPWYCNLSFLFFFAF